MKKYNNNIHNYSNNFVTSTLNKYLFNSKQNISKLVKNYPFGSIMSAMIVVFIFLFYFTAPTYYNYDEYGKELNEKVSKDFKLNLKNIKGIKYLILPKPHFLIEECDIYFENNPENKIINAKNLIIKIYSKNLFNKSKIELKSININKNDFNLNFDDIKNFYFHIKQNIHKPIYLKQSNLFFKNKNDEIMSISKIHKFKYNFNYQKKEKNLNILGNLFGSKITFNWNRNYNNPLQSNSEIKIKNPNIIIKNNFNSKNSKFNEAETNFKFLNNTLDLSYNFNKKYIKFYNSNNKKLKQNASSLDGQINLNPFFIDLKLILSGIKIETVLNYIFSNLYNLNQKNHSNLSGNLKINLNEFKSRLFENLIFNINFNEEKISLENSSINFKKIGIIHFSDPILFERNKELIVKSKIKLDINNENELLKRFQINKKNEITLERIFFELEYNVDRGEYFLSSLNLTEKLRKDIEFYEINNIQQLTYTISKELENIIEG